MDGVAAAAQCVAVERVGRGLVGGTASGGCAVEGWAGRKVGLAVMVWTSWGKNY